MHSETVEIDTILKIPSSKHQIIQKGFYILKGEIKVVDE